MDTVQIPPNAKVGPGATFTNWQLWLDAALAGALDTITNDPNDNYNSKNSKLFGALCSIGQLVSGGHIERETAEQQARQVVMLRHASMPEKEFDRQWENALKRTANNGRLYEPKPQQNGHAPTPAANEQLQPGYHIMGGRLALLEIRTNGDEEVKPIADIGAKITSVTIAENGSRSYAISGEGWRSGKFDLEIDSSEFESDTKLRGALGGLCPLDPIYPRMSQHLPAAIKKVSSNLTFLKRFHRTGWNGNQFLIDGMLPEGTEIDLPDDLPYSVKPGDLDNALITLESLICSLPPEFTTPVLAAVLGAPLAQRSGFKNKRYGMFIVGRTGSLKTAWATAALSIYGPGFLADEKYIKWGDGATQNALMRLASQAHDMPLLIDNFKPNTGGGNRAFVSLVHAIIEGGEKKRLNRNSELRDSREIFSWPIFTGEALPAVDVAAIARMLVIEFPWNKGGVNKNLEYVQSMNNLSAIGYEWLRWLNEVNAKQCEADFIQLRDTLNQHLINTYPDMQNKLRIAQNLAINCMTWNVFCSHPVFKQLGESYREHHWQGIIKIARTLSTNTEGALEATRFMEGIRQLVTLQQALLPELDGYPSNTSSYDHNRVIGWIKDDHVYIMPDWALALFKKNMSDDLNGFDQGAISRQLDGLGLLVSHNEGRLTKRLRVGKISPGCWHMRKDAIYDAPTPPEPVNL